MAPPKKVFGPFFPQLMQLGGPVMNPKSNYFYETPDGLQLGTRKILSLGEDENLTQTDAEALKRSVGGWDSKSRIAALGASPMNFNSYELLYRYLRNEQYTPTNITNMINYFVECGSNVVRFAYPTFFKTDYEQHVFALPGNPVGEIVDSHFKPEFLVRSDLVFNMLAQAKLKGFPCLFFSVLGAADLCGETVLQAVKTTSQTYDFMLRFTTWFGKRYGFHPGFGVYSFFNEQPYDVTGVTHPTPADLGAVHSGLIAEMRKHSPHTVATSDFVILPLGTLFDRPNFSTEVENIKTIAKGVDALGVHIYGDSAAGVGMSFVGMFGLGTAAFRPSTTNKLGFEGLESFLTAMNSVAQSMDVEFWPTEIGVPNSLETEASKVRKSKLLNLCAQYAGASFIWNAADVASPQSDQITWQIRPGTTLGNNYKAMVKAINSGRTPRKALGVGAGTPALLARLQPKYCMTGAAGRGAGDTISFASVPLMTTSTQVFMAWIRRDAPFNAFEVLVEARGAGQLSGFALVAGATPNTVSEYGIFRGPSGDAGNSSGRFPRTPDGEWYHMALVEYTINGQLGYLAWMNGMFFGPFAATNAYAGIPDATAITILGGANGAPVSMQDVTFAHYASPEDIWDHMQGAILPQASVHLRADNTGIRNFGKAAITLTVDPLVTYGPA